MTAIATQQWKHRETIRIVALLIAVVVCCGFGFSVDANKTREALDKRATGGTVIFNQDASEFFVGTFGPILPKTLDDYVDSLAQAGITDLFINVNYKRTNYRSKVWEADWDGYDPKLGDDQPFFAGIAADRPFERTWIKNALSLHQQGVDYGAHVLSLCRKNGINGWISIRMNDSHYPNQPDHPFHSRFWKQHPEWHITHKSLDYGQPEVRRHYLALIEEVLQRYDMVGLELDFMRHGYYFREGKEFDGVPVMDALVAEVRRLTKAAERRWNHSVKLSVRVPTRSWVSRSRGLDAVNWAKAGWIDWITLAPWWSSTQSDVPVETWKGLLAQTNTRIAACLEDGIDSGGKRRRTLTVEEARAVALSGLHRGADAIYLFNFFTGPYQWDRTQYHQFLADAGSFEDLRKRSRSHALTLTDPWAVGEPGDPRPLPFSGKQGAFRLYTGPRPLQEQATEIIIETGTSQKPARVSLNGIACPWRTDDGNRHHYRVPPEAASEGYNLVQFGGDTEIQVIWLEVAIK